MHAHDQISAEVSYLAPINTSGLLYCLVWISVAKWWWVQQAFPKSAILTLNPFSSFGPLSKISLLLITLKRSLILFFYFFLITEGFAYYNFL
jgi:hypothetical protein